MGDQYYLTIDNDEPDTKANQLFFQRHFEMEIPKDIRNLYCQEYFGILDGSQEMVFECAPETFDKLVLKLKLEYVGKKNESVGSLLKKNKKEIDNLPAYYRKPIKNNYCYHCLWYNKASKQAFFLSYDT